MHPSSDSDLFRPAESTAGLLRSDELHTLWQSLNDRHFHSRLPTIDIVWSRRLTASAGMFVSSVGPRSDRPAMLPTGRRLIRLSVPLLEQQSWDELINTLAHEMIHQWQFDVLKRRPNHGQDFSRKMSEMNDGGLSITIHHALDHLVQRLAKYAWRCLRCGRAYERQRRTIRPSRHRCGECEGQLEEVRPTRTKRRTPRGSPRGRPLQLQLF
jgi:predicted SprT family Zn-dependent metalloprotease